MMCLMCVILFAYVFYCNLHEVKFFRVSEIYEAFEIVFIDFSRLVKNTQSLCSTLYIFLYSKLNCNTYNRSNSNRNVNLFSEIYWIDDISYSAVWDSYEKISVWLNI